MTDAGKRIELSAGWAFWFEYVRRLAVATVRDFLRHNGFTSSAALAFYFQLSLLPFLIFLASALALLPIRHLAARMIQLVSHFVPSDTMPMLQSVMNATMRHNHGLVSAGFIFALIAASGAFAAMAASLDVIYEVKETRSFWERRLGAIGITFVVGGMTLVGLTAMLLGPHFGRELARVFDVSHAFVEVWPFLRWLLAVTCALASIEMLYYLGVSRRHTLRQQFPGTVFAVAVWIVSSELLGIYFRRFSDMNAMYGTLASFVVLAVWLQLTAAAILLGAELNVQIERSGLRARNEVRGEKSLPAAPQDPTPSPVP